MLAALTIGYKNNLDDETKSAYATSGAMHILAVSGLHVGIVYLILKIIFGLFKQNRPVVILKVLFSFIFLWLYAAITGFSPSVVRAAIMFSFILAGDLANRKTNIYNSIFASAFVLLLINPFLVMEVGFKLSYFAVLGIVFFYPRIYGLLEVKNRVLNKLWSLFCVSMAAQLCTFPLGLYYFHQFPNYFFITNLFVVPLAGLIIYSTVIFLLSFSISYAGTFTAWIINFLLTLLNKSVHFIENLPGSVTNGIYLSGFEVITIYVILFLLIILILIRNKIVIFSLLASFLILLSSIQYRRFENHNFSAVAILSVPGHSILNIITGNRNYIFSDSIDGRMMKKINYAGSGFWNLHGTDNPEFISWDNSSPLFKTIKILDATNQNEGKQDKFLIFKDECFLILRNGKILEYTNGINLDNITLVVTGDFTGDFHELRDCGIEWKAMILDSSLKRWQTEKLELTDNDRKVIWNVNKQGAWLLNK